jgi:hypothetical protein
MPFGCQKTVGVGAPTSTLQPSNFGASDGAPRDVFASGASSPAFEKPIRRQEMHQMLQPAMFIGLGLVAFWFYLRYPRLRPRSLALAAIHVAVSFGAFALLPLVLGLLLPITVSPGQAVYVVLVLLIPTLTYILLSWVWLLARILHDFSRGPRGGHPAATDR